MRRTIFALVEGGTSRPIKCVQMGGEDPIWGERKIEIEPILINVSKFISNRYIYVLLSITIQIIGVHQYYTKPIGICFHISAYRNIILISVNMIKT